MLSSALPLLALSALSNAVAIERRQDVTPTYHYIPVDYEYGYDSRVTANLTFGSDSIAKPVKVVMDSGSSNFWVWAPGAVVHWGSQYLGVVGPCNETVPTEYDPSTSTTSVVSNHSSTYAYAGNSKIVTGATYSNDTVTAEGGSGGIPNVQFALEDYGLLKIGDNGSCTYVEYDTAILGLSPYTNTTAGPSFRQNLYETSEITSRTMVMWFNKHVGAIGKLTGGALFGAIDTSKFTGPLVRVPNAIETDQIGVYVPKPNVTINNITFVTDQDTNCLVDSGAHGDSLPFAYGGTESARFFAESGLIEVDGSVGYNGSCESIPADMKFSYSFPAEKTGEFVNIDVPVRNYARGYPNVFHPGVCVLNLEVGGCTFGAPFSSGVFMALDDEDGSIAFAQGGVSEEGSGIDEASLKTIGKGQSFDTV
ncbi:hypothetical protein LSUE1_G003797 [Lachnellula suecica]|uniref:Peptidase A1 domain-containing protein n=1 Tax=Lachnellula suecica TaxID=602035 RepID=A0A8T9C300_9HELO|nr:hypothetical protein LSUE1_G003797 [Lachnellula suecica]